MAVQHFRELIVWQKAIDLVVLVYKISARFPREEMYGFSAQIRKAAVSIPSNIAEGQGRAGVGEFRHFLGIARGSLREVGTQFVIAERLQLVCTEDVRPAFELAAEVGRLLNGLDKSLAPPH